MKNLEIYRFIALVLVIIGGVNWGLVGIFNVNLLSAILGGFLGRLFFIGIGAAAGYLGYLIYLEKVKKV
jgi:uncharacterized membrane protein YuzA (DUF378 family)